MSKCHWCEDDIKPDEPHLVVPVRKGKRVFHHTDEKDCLKDMEEKGGEKPDLDLWRKIL